MAEFDELVQSTTQERNDLVAKIEELEGEKNGLIDLNNARRADISSTTETLHKTIRQKDEANMSLARANQEIQSLTAQLSQTQNTLSIRVRELNETTDRLKQKYADHEELGSRTTEERERLESNIKDLEGEREDLTARLNRANIEI